MFHVRFEFYVIFVFSFVLLLHQTGNKEFVAIDLCKVSILLYAKKLLFKFVNAIACGVRMVYLGQRIMCWRRQSV